MCHQQFRLNLGGMHGMKNYLCLLVRRVAGSVQIAQPGGTSCRSKSQKHLVLMAAVSRDCSAASSAGSGV